MVATAAAIATILGTAVQAGSTIAGTMGRRDTQAQAGNQYAANQLQDARNNDMYQRALSTLINQRSIAGSTDEYGSTMRYDPATNQWVSSLGAQPKAVQDASDLANISRNTTDLRQAQDANAEAVKRANLARPGADTAIRNLQTQRDMPASALVGLLQQRATDAARSTFDPLNADFLRQSQRTGTSAGSGLAALGKQEYDSLRDSLVDSQIKGLTGVDAINQGRRTSLENSATNNVMLATPQFQYPQIQQATNRDALSNLVAARAQQGGIAPAYGAGGVNTGSKGVQDAYGALQKSLYTPSNPIASAGKEIGSLLNNKNTLDSIQTVYNKVFPDPTTKTANSSYQYDPSAYATAGGGGTKTLTDLGFYTPLGSGSSFG